MAEHLELMVTPAVAVLEAELHTFRPVAICTLLLVVGVAAVLLETAIIHIKTADLTITEQ
jgi:hypothetical protein